MMIADEARRPIKLGRTIKPLSISDRCHTKSTFKPEPRRTKPTTRMA